MTKDLDEQLQLAHKVVDVVDSPYRYICKTLAWYKGDRPENSYAGVRIFAKKKEDKNFQQIVYVKYKPAEFIYLLDVMNSVCSNVNTNKPICNVE